MTRFHHMMQNLQPQRHDGAAGNGMPLLSMTILLPTKERPEDEPAADTATLEQAE